MLTRILATLRAAGRPLCRADLQGELAVEASALQGMLDTLVARGRLRVVRFEDDGCGGCPIRSGCYIMAEQAALTYALPPDQAAEPLIVLHVGRT